MAKADTQLNQIKTDFRQFVNAFCNKPSASNRAALEAEIEAYRDRFLKAQADMLDEEDEPAEPAAKLKAVS